MRCLTKAQQAKRTIGGGRGDVSSTIKIADQEDIVLRRWESDYCESQRGSSS
jgi:hypothetical protein